MALQVKLCVRDGICCWEQLACHFLYKSWQIKKMINVYLEHHLAFVSVFLQIPSCPVC